MDEIRTMAWIMYALGGASQREAGTFAAISQIADGMNHAVPTQKELQSSLKWLITHRLAQKQGSRYSLTLHGTEIMAAAHTDERTVASVWDALTRILHTLPSEMNRKG
jgi:hypothetical protein